jgi:hypothetical protein
MHQPTAVTRFNALRHGVLSRYTVLPWVDENEYRELLNAVVGEHKPEGPTEEHLVEEMVGVLWRKRRLKARRGCGLSPGPQKCGFTRSTDNRGCARASRHWKTNCSQRYDGARRP